VEPTTVLESQNTADAPAGERYLLLVDISGYTSFMAGVEQEHGLDFSRGVPAAYPILAALLGSIVAGVEPDFSVVKLEGDAVFAAAPAATLDGRGEHILDLLAGTYSEFIGARTRAIPSHDHVCTACPNVAKLDLKAVLHRGPAVRQAVGSGSDLLGPSVTLAHRLLKNTVRDRIGRRPYLFVTDAAASGLGLTGIGLEHDEVYPDAGPVRGRIIELASDARNFAGTSSVDLA
jgi:class 3 adenylate cyclase